LLQVRISFHFRIVLKYQLTLQIGGGSGYGAGIAKRFAQEGAKVIIADINVDGGRQVAQSFSDQMIFQKTNVAREGDWYTLMKEATKAFGRVDCLVNNAGTTYKNKVSFNSLSC
jgi:NAD(P)-dependent dehydrogenase (short-subunit alcohol dehydrogenase family)